MEQNLTEIRQRTMKKKIAKNSAKINVKTSKNCENLIENKRKKQLKIG